MRGTYRDVVRDPFGRTLADSGWRSNTIVLAAWPLMAGLLKNDPSLRGILFWAVGGGLSAWDAVRPPADITAARLAEEFDRMPVAPEAMVYIGADGRPSGVPTPCIEAAVVFTWGRNLVLREFGLFGGDATETPGSGILINHVIHPRMEIAAGRTLTRRLRLTLCPDIGPEWHAVPSHWLGRETVEWIDGVGGASAGSLNRAGILTIRALAVMVPVHLDENVSLMRAVGLRAKARMALRTAAGLTPVSGLNDRTVWDILATPTATLIAESGAAADEVFRLQEHTGALQMALDNRYLRQVTVGQMAQQG
ncbi:hypothetical protein [Desulfococcus sp.]|uniref:hypothetical protein n=1 Tax=Desulfococcus sp. TaxID=2025834 RepID=UPI0035937955